MFDYKHYVPILKSKKAELNALRELTPDVKGKISPLLRITPIPKNKKTNELITVAQHLKNVGKDIAKSLHGHKAVFIDLLDVTPISHGKVDPLSIIDFFKNIQDPGLFEQIRGHGLNVIPVSGFDRMESYLKMVKTVCGEMQSGVCLWLRRDDIEDVRNLKSLTKEALTKHNVSAANCDIIIDLEDLTTLPFGNGTELVRRVNDLISKFPDIQAWRTFTISSSSFPESLTSGFKTRSRDDYKFWKNLIENKKELKRLPSYGDYAIQHPSWEESSGQFFTSIANLRYASNEQWLLYRGRNFKKKQDPASTRKNFLEFNKLCSELTSRTEYDGPNYCWADKRIDEYAKYTLRKGTGEIGTGSATTWRQIGFNRHMTVAARQVV